MTTPTPNFIVAIPDTKPLRFTAGKLVMLSPKHKLNLGSIQCKMFDLLPEGSTQPSEALRPALGLGSGPTFLPFDTDKKYPIGFVQQVGPSVIGKPILLVEDPFLVEAKGMPSYILYNRKSEPFWVMKVLYEDKLHLFICSKKTWKHYLAIIKPKRAEKYGL